MSPGPERRTYKPSKGAIPQIGYLIKMVKISQRYRTDVTLLRILRQSLPGIYNDKNKVDLLSRSTYIPDTRLAFFIKGFVERKAKIFFFDHDNTT